ncbi:MAG: citrate lyase subunit beta, partial [Candidatus Riflebacteria bacterium]|nr:citrate lyase subunit beta [Candidatus Riflebacteria bacterium]
MIVRINPLTGPFGHDDLNEIVPALPHVILIPKCEAASDIIE